MSTRKPLSALKLTAPTAVPEASRADLLEAIRYDTPTGTRDLVSLHPNPAPTRALDAHHVVDLARSIAAVGLIEPLVIDIEDVVIAGSHRYAALRLLRSSAADRLVLLGTLCPEANASLLASLGDSVAQLPASTLDFHRIPVHIIPYSKREHPDETWRIEVAENEQRRDYKPREVKQLAERLKAQGYTSSMNPGDPAPRLMPVLTALIGKSERHIRRLIKAASEPDVDPVPPPRTNVRAILNRDANRITESIKKFKEVHNKHLEPGDHRTVARMLAMLERLAR